VEPSVTAVGLEKRFGDTHALAGIDLAIAPGEALALLGHNGAGKTTAVRILATLLRPDGGTATIAGRDVVREAAAVRELISLAGQHATLDESLTGRENLVLLGRLQRLSRAAARARADELLERFQLSDAASRLVSTYSGGMRRRLDLAACLVVRRPVVFLDEPTTGLDPVGRNAVWEIVRRLVDDGASLLLTTQYLEEADRLADRVTVLSRGREVASGTPAELKEQVGGRRIEIALGPERHEAAVGALAAAGIDAAVDPVARHVTAPAPDGDDDLQRVLATLAASRIAVDEIALRRPTLDDAYFALAVEDELEEAA
jgi:ABC-2 type transport system ATP-binding protein